MLWLAGLEALRSADASSSSVVAAYDTSELAGGRATLRGMVRSPFDELVHRVNNLLGTIELQGEVARLDGTLEAHAEAMRLIVESARRTLAEMRELQAEVRRARTD